MLEFQRRDGFSKFKQVCNPLCACAPRVNKYELLLSNLESNSYAPEFLAMEIGVLGHHRPGTVSALHNLFPSIPKNSFRALLDNAGKTAISTFRPIFMARREEAWSNSQPLL